MKWTTHLVPNLSILFPTHLIVPSLSVQQKNDKEDEVKVGEGCVEASWKTPGEATRQTFITLL